MKTFKNVVGLNGISTLIIAFVLLLASCSKSTEPVVLDATDTQNVNSESVSDSYSDESTDMANISVAGSGTSYAGGRSEGEPIVIVGLKDIDDKFKCATVTIDRTPDSTPARPVGKITIDFGTTDCADGRGVVRKGKIIINYVGARFAVGSTIITTFNGFFRNGVKIEGVHTLTNVQAPGSSNPKFTVAIVGGKLTFADGKIITREQSFTREWQRNVTDPTKDKWVVSGSASGTNKNLKKYEMVITKDLVYSRACAISDKVFIPVSGTKVFTTDNKTFTVDYGDGACDNIITVSTAAGSKTITVDKDGN